MKSRKSQRGASLIDALMGTALFIGTATTFTANTIAVVRGGASSERTVAASALANNFVERLRGMEAWELVRMEDGVESGLDALGQTGSGGAYTRAWTILLDVPHDGLAEVEVVVSWNDGQPQQITTLAYVCITPSCS